MENIICDKYTFEFTDSVFAFDEDLDDTLKIYSSISEINCKSVKDALFILHTNCMILRNENVVSENLFMKYNLSEYGYGPDYDKDNIFLLMQGKYNIIEKSNSKIFLQKLDSKEIIQINNSDFEYFFEDDETIENCNYINVDDSIEIFVCINNEYKKSIINQLSKDIKNLNNLFKEIGLNERTIKLIEK